MRHFPVAIVEGGVVKHYASFDRPAPNEGGDFSFARALVCPQCLLLWCTIKDLTEQHEFHIIAEPCEQCSRGGGYNSVPGSVLKAGDHSLDYELLNLLPLAMVKREFDLHIKAIGNECDYFLGPYERLTIYCSDSSGPVPPSGSERSP